MQNRLEKKQQILLWKKQQFTNEYALQERRQQTRRTKTANITKEYITCAAQHFGDILHK